MAYPLQYSCLENSMGREAWQVTESDTTEQHTCACIHTHTHTHTHTPGASRRQQRAADYRHLSWHPGTTEAT